MVNCSYSYILGNMSFSTLTPQKTTKKKQKTNSYNENTTWKTQNEQLLDRVQSMSCFSKVKFQFNE